MVWERLSTAEILSFPDQGTDAPMGWSELMRPIIEFCVNNLTPDVLKIKEELEQDPELDVVEYGCLGHCMTCAEGPYALVNGDVVTGETAEELLRNIRRAIREFEEFGF
jgi:uncharacterized protein YuzB (UPF0349 family)